MINFRLSLMAEQPIIPASDQPVRIRWLNAAGKRFCFWRKWSVWPNFKYRKEQNPSVLKPTAQMAQPTPIKTAKLTAPSVFNKTKVKVRWKKFAAKMKTFRNHFSDDERKFSRSKRRKTEFAEFCRQFDSISKRFQRAQCRRQNENCEFDQRIGQVRSKKEIETNKTFLDHFFQGSVTKNKRSKKNFSRNDELLRRKSKLC